MKTIPSFQLRPWLRPLLLAVACCALLWASGGAASFFPPWVPSRGALGAVWPPLLATGIALLGIATAQGAFAALWPRLPSRAPRWLNPSSAAAPHRFRIEPMDWVLALALAVAQYAVVDLYRDFYNPENQAIGHDNYAFLSTAVASASERWDLYMVDKRPFYGILTSWFAPLFDGDLIRSAVGMNMAAMSLTQVPMYMLGRIWGGRTAGLAAGLMLLGSALFYPYAHEISSYPLYMLVSTTVVVAVSWALLRPSLRATLFAGITMGVLTLVQVKNFTFNIPMVGILGMSILLDGQGRRLQRALATLGPIAIAVGLLHMHPVEFTPLNVLVMHHREEVNYEIPHQWEETLTPDRRNPSPLSPYLPKFLRGGELEATTGVMMSPANSNVIAAFPQDGPTPRWEIVPRTTIPPLTKRLEHNLRQAAVLAPGLGSILVPLMGLGFLWSMILPTSPLRRRWGIPTDWWKAAVLLVPIASCFGSFSLKFNLRYIFHAAPTVFVLVGIAGCGAASLMSRRGGGLWQSSTRLVALFLGLSMGIALFIRAPLIQRPLDEGVVSSAFFRLPPDARQLMGKGYRLVSAYVDSHIGPTAKLYDCTPIALGLYRPSDERLIRPKNGSERDKLCKKQLATPATEESRFLVLTSIPEFFGPDAVTPVHAAAAGWTLLYGFDMHEPRELGDPEDLSNIGSGWIAVFTDTPTPEHLGHSMLNGQSPTTGAMAKDAPTKPNRSAGAPAPGNP